MDTIRMVDLVKQHARIKDEISVAIQQVIEAAAFIRGPEVASFEAKLAAYLGVKHVITCANGTDALQIALMALNLQPGDEVITPDFTFIATVEVIALLGLTPVLADVTPGSFNIDVAQLEKKIGPRTKAIIPVHLFGQCADMELIMTLARKYSLHVVEDAAQAMGAEFLFSNGSAMKAGTIGEIGCTSFFPSKNLACMGDGGALFTNNDELADRCRMIANHGMKKRYYHDIIGVNSRLDTLQAAILLVKLKYLDQYNALRRRAADYYDNALGSIQQLTVPVRETFSSHVFHQYTIKFSGPGRDELKTALENRGIPGMVYYPVPLHRQKALMLNRYSETDFPVTNDLCNKVLSLPMHTELDAGQLAYICQTITELIANY